MPLPRSMANFNRYFANPVFLRVTGHLPGFAIMRHVGRKSGRVYHIPVIAVRHDGEYIIALTYGAESDWVQNVLAAGSCELLSRGRWMHLSDPHIETDQSKRWAPLPIRLLLSLVRAPQYMRLSL